MKVKQCASVTGASEGIVLIGTGNKKEQAHKEPAPDCHSMGRKLSLVGLPHLFEETLPGSSLLLLALDTRLFIVLALSHFRENASFFYLLLEAAESQIKVVVIEKNSGHENHLLPYHFGITQTAA